MICVRKVFLDRVKWEGCGEVSMSGILQNPWRSHLISLSLMDAGKLPL